VIAASLVKGDDVVRGVLAKEQSLNSHFSIRHMRYKKKLRKVHCMGTFKTEFDCN
jgi:hypothetical protein